MRISDWSADVCSSDLRWFAVAQRRQPPQASELRFSDEGHAIQAAVAGHGIALVSLALIADELDAGHPVQPFGPEIDGHTYHLAISADRPPSAPVKAVADRKSTSLNYNH